MRTTNYKLQTNSGYTLVEAIVYVAILAILSVVFINLLLTMTRSYAEFRITRNLNTSAQAAMERLVRSIRNATSVDISSTLGTNPGRLVLNTLDGSGDPLTIDFYLSDDTLMVKEGSGAAASTTAKYVTVDNLIFRKLTTPVSSVVKIEMTLGVNHGAINKTAKFYSTAVLRGSY